MTYFLLFILYNLNGDIMRTYYIFKIDKKSNTIYKRNKTAIYKLLYKINKLGKSEYKLGNRLYKNIIIPLDKIRINNYILSNHINDIYYKKEDNLHSLDSAFEKSRLIVYNTYIKIITTNNISSFFKDLSPISNNLFCVDFNNTDYFYIDELELKSLV